MTKVAKVAMEFTEDAELVAAAPPSPAETSAEEDATGAVELPKAAVLAEDGSVTLKLKRPITVGTIEPGGAKGACVYAELTLHELTGADLRKLMSAKREDAPILMLQLSTRLTLHRARQLFDQMTQSDITALTRVIDFFDPDGRTTGRST
jgi:hypothetical protein